MQPHQFLRSLVVTAFVSLASLASAAADPHVLADRNGILIEDGYAFATGPRAPTGAAVMRITNRSGADDRLLEVRSDTAARTVLHGSEMKNGVSSMQALDGGAPLPAGQTLVLERGGMHVMMMGLTRPLSEGASVPMTLVFAHAGPIEVSLPVELALPVGAGPGPMKMPPAGD